MFVKIVMSFLGPIKTSGLYYYDIYTDFYLMQTLFNNCHNEYGYISLVIIVSVAGPRGSLCKTLANLIYAKRCMSVCPKNFPAGPPLSVLHTGTYFWHLLPLPKNKISSIFSCQTLWHLFLAPDLYLKTKSPSIFFLLDL